MNVNVTFLRRAQDIRHARLSGWDVDVAANQVRRGEFDIRLTPKAMGVLRQQRASAQAAALRADPAAAQLEPVALTSDPSREQFPSLSPDGSTVAYAAVQPDGGSSRIMVKSVDPSALSVTLTDPRLPL